MALGYTLQLPLEDKFLVSKTEIENQLKIMMGGRVAEEIIFGSITTGASNDIDRATDMARDYVCRYGMSEKLGTRRYGRAAHQVFLGRDYTDHSKDYSEATAREIDEAVRELIQEAYDSAKTILSSNKEKLEKISKILLEKEVLDTEEFEALMTDELPVAAS
jgi:cell division protease FtsH